MSIYPGITGHYSPAAWARAELMTDGRITDALLAGCEAAIEAERTDPHWHERNLRQCREMVAYDERRLAAAERRGDDLQREIVGQSLAHSRLLLAEAEAAMAAEREAAR